MSVICPRDTQCYVTSGGRGVAYGLWERIDRILYERRMTQKELVERSGVSAMTINRLKTQTRTPNAKTVHALADALGIDRDEAGVLAGRLRPTGAPGISVRDAIELSDTFSQAQKRALLETVDAMEAANRAGQRPASTEPSDAPARSDDERPAI